MSSKYFTDFNKEYIATYVDTYSPSAIARQLEIPTKEVDKYITRVHGKQLSTNPTLVVWDVRDKYDGILERIEDNNMISDEDIAAFIGIEA